MSVTAKVVTCDTTAPELTLPNDTTAEATSASGAVVTFSASAYDAGDAKNTDVTCSPASGSTFALGATTVNCSSTDSKGNKATGSFKVTVQDTTKPAISGTPGDITKEATGSTGATASWTAPTASDTVDGTVVVSCTPTSGSTFALGTTAVKCSATDNAGNKAESGFNVTVEDTTKPTLNVPQDITKEATSANGAQVSYSASAEDTVDGGITPSCAPTSGSTFALGTTAVKCSATDNAGNKAERSFNVTVEDTTKPELKLPSNQTVEAASKDGAKVSYDVSASDIVDGTVAVSCAPLSGTTFGMGETTVNCSATDKAGNKETGSFKVGVVDTTAPKLTLPADQRIEATSKNGAVATFAGSASDLVDGSVNVTCDATSGSTFALGTTTINCAAKDSAGNEAKGSFKIFVEDTTKPELTVPADITEEAAAASGAKVSFSASAEDIVSGEITPICTPASGSTFALGSTLVKCEATDGWGNTDSRTFTITVQDTTAPEISGMPENFDLDATSAAGAVANWTAPTAEDVVDGRVAVSCDKQSGTTFPLGITTVKCSAADSTKNTANKSFTVAVNDKSAPQISEMPQNIELEATGAAGAVATWTETPTAMDAVDGAVTVTCDAAPGDTFKMGTTTVTCSATDSAKNTAQASFTVTVVDTTAPAISKVPADIQLEATSAAGAVATWNAPTASDKVDGSVAVSCNPTSGSTFKLGTTTVVCTATDKANNQGVASFTVTVKDSTAPEIAGMPSDITVVTSSATGAVATWTAPTAKDVVDGTVSVSCSPASGSTFPLGTTIVTCTATDKASNKDSKTFNVSVVYGWSGVLEPINSNGSSIFKLGSTVPVKFKLTGTSAGITNATAKLYVAKITDGVVGSELEAASTSAADSGNTFRYDSSNGQYIFNLGTKSLSQGAFQLRIDLGDGTINTVTVSLKK